MDISGLRNTSGIGLIFAAQTPDEFSLDLDDVEIFVVPGGGDPNPVDFTALTVTDAKVKIHKKRKKDKHPKDKDEFEIKKGQLTLGDDFDGFDLDTEDLTITFGDLEWTIPAGSFVRDDDDDDDDDDGKWKFRSKRPDDLHIDIRDDGRVRVKKHKKDKKHDDDDDDWGDDDDDWE